MFQFQQYNYFRWYDREYTDYQLMYVNSLRRAKEDLKDERNEVLVQAGEANAICELRQVDYATIKIEMVQ